MPSNEVIINGNIKYEVPDSYMEPLEAYLKMVKEKTRCIVCDCSSSFSDQDDSVPEEGQVYDQGAPTLVDKAEGPVPVQNDSFSQKLANESLHMVSELVTTLGPVLLPDDGTIPGVREASPVVETWQAVHAHLGKLVKRVDL
jgi:hypothetical protein